MMRFARSGREPVGKRGRRAQHGKKNQNCEQMSLHNHLNRLAAGYRPLLSGSSPDSKQKVYRINTLKAFTPL